jgi:predicted DNA-binding protein
MTILTIELPDGLRQRAEKIIAQRGATIEHLIRELLEEYLDEAENVQAASNGDVRMFKNDPSNDQDDYPSLEEVVAKIRATPSDPSNIHPATQSVVEALANAPYEPPIDLEAWNREWAKVEAELKAMTRADDKAEGRA